MTFDLPGNAQWGQQSTYIIQLDGYEPAVDVVQVFDADIDVPVVMQHQRALDMTDFVKLSTWWQMNYCQWSNYCDKADMNFDGTVDMADLVIFSSRWLND